MTEQFKFDPINRKCVSPCGVVSVREVLASRSPNGTVMRTFIIEMYRGVLAEYNTHKMLSRNVSSSRAIKFESMVNSLNAMPYRFGKHMSGMQDAGEHNQPIKIGKKLYAPANAWTYAKNEAVKIAEAFFKADYAKQVYNRLLEPFQQIKMVTSGTEWNNFLWLRDHKAADPSIAIVASMVSKLIETSNPINLKAGQYHIPFVDVTYDNDDNQQFSYQGNILNVDDALTVSAALCAATSYRLVDYDLDKCRMICKRLMEDQRVHASPFEHQAIAIPKRNRFTKYLNCLPFTWHDGVTHVDKNYDLWSANLKGFVQYRKLIPNDYMAG